MNWLSSLQFANAFAFGLAAATPLLLLAYLKRKKFKPKTVSSVLLLQVLPKHVALRQRFKPPLRFYLELLTLLLLLSAIASPLTFKEGARIAVVLDNSMSMNASGGFAGKRLDLGKKKLLEWLSEADSENSYTLFASSPILTQVGEELLSASGLNSAAQSIASGHGGSVLQTAVSELGASGEYDSVLIVSDNRAEMLFDNIAASGSSTSVSALTAGVPSANYFIADFRIEQAGVGGATRRAAASIGISASQAGEVKASLFGLSKKEATLNTGTLIAEKTLLIEPNKSTEVAFKLGSKHTNKKAFRLELSSAVVGNSLQEDDAAWATAETMGKPKMLLVSPEADDRALGLSAISGVEVVQSSPAEYPQLAASELSQFSLLIFHKSAPAAVPAVSTLLILPPENSVFPLKATSTTSSISSWKQTHPLVSYLRVPLLNPSLSLIFDVPPWAASIINVEQGSVLAAGESRGVRFAALGVEVLPFEGEKTPVTTVLLLNLLRWLSGSSSLHQGHLTGDALNLDGDKTWVVLPPRKTADESLSAVTLESTREKPVSYVLEQPGLYLITSVSGKSAGSIRKTSKLIAVNSLFPEESDTFILKAIRLQNQIPHQQKSLRDLAPLWFYFLQAAFAILLLEALLRLIARKNEEGALSST